MIQFDSDLFDPSIAEEFANDGGGLFGIPWFDGPSLWQMLLRFALNLAVCWFIVGCLYYKKSKRSYKRRSARYKSRKSSARKRKSSTRRRSSRARRRR